MTQRYATEWGIVRFISAQNVSWILCGFDSVCGPFLVRLVRTVEAPHRLNLYSGRIIRTAEWDEQKIEFPNVEVERPSFDKRKTQTILDDNTFFPEFFGAFRFDDDRMTEIYGEDNSYTPKCRSTERSAGRLVSSFGGARTERA